jgi:hypothetical protein
MMDLFQSADCRTDLAASVAPEDLRCGDFVALLSVVHEFPSFFWSCGSGALACDRPVRVECTGTEDGAPLRIEAICLPFVFVKDAAGKYRTLDVRLCRLARLSADYGRKVWKALRRQAAEAEPGQP